MTCPALSPLLILVFSLSAPSTVLGERCEDCNTVVAGLQTAALSNESIAMQQGMIVNMICPDAGLGGPDDHPNCEKFTAHHFPDLAKALFPISCRLSSAPRTSASVPPPPPGQARWTATPAPPSPGWQLACWARRTPSLTSLTSSPQTFASMECRRVMQISVTVM